MSKLLELKKQDSGLFNMIKQFIDEWVSKLREYYGKDGIYVTPIGKQASELEQFEKLQQLFAEALVDAGENYQKAQKNTTLEGGEKRMSRDQNQNVIVDEDVDLENVRMTLTEIYNGSYKSNNNYFPVLKNTPKVYMDYCHLDADRSFVMAKKKAYKAMQQKNKNQHNLGVDGLMYVIENLGAPDYIIYQNFGEYKGNYAAVIISEEREIFAAVQLGEYKDAQYAPNGEKGYYNTLITAFYPNEGYLDNNIFIPENDVVYDKNEDPLQVASGVTPSDRAERSSKSSIRNSDGIVNTETEKAEEKKSERDEEFDYSGLNWATELGIITAKDRAIFERTINNEIYRGAKPQSANGEYIIDTGKCLLFTDGDFHRPTLSCVIVFSTEYESLLDESKRRIIYEAGSTGDIQVSKRIIENLYGPGFAVEYTPEVYRSHAGQNRGGKRANSKRGNRSYPSKSLKERFAAEGKEYLLDDDADEQELYSDRDDAYMEAINRRDMETVQELADEDIRYSERDIDSFDIASYPRIKMSRAEWRRFESEAMTWNADKVGKVLYQTLANGFTYVYTFNEDYSLTVFNKYKATNIHERQGVIDDKRNREKSDRNNGESRSGRRDDTPGMLSPDGGEAKRSSTPSEEAQSEVWQGNRRGYAEDAFDVDETGIKRSARVGDSISNRSLLANALESLASDDKERSKIAEYKASLEAMEAEEAKLRELNAQIKELSFAKGKRDMEKIRKLRDEVRKTTNRINIYDKQLLRLEAAKPLQKVLERERKRAYDRAKQKNKEAMARVRETASMREAAKKRRARGSPLCSL